MAVKYYTDGTDFRLPAKARTAEWLVRAAEGEGHRTGPVNFIFCSRERHLAINRQYLGHDWPTDVITFDCRNADGGSGGGNTASKISGDIFIDPLTVAENAERFMVDRDVEMRRVMVHGVLHLCGQGDKTPKQRRRMRAKEDHYLAKYYESI